MMPVFKPLKPAFYSSLCRCILTILESAALALKLDIVFKMATRCSNLLMDASYL